MPYSNSIAEGIAVQSKHDFMHARRILFSCWNFRIGGQGSFTLNFARAFQNLGYTVGVLVPEPFGELYSDFRDILEVKLVRRGFESRGAYLQRLIGEINEFRPQVLINNSLPMVQAAIPFLSDPVVRISVVHSLMESETRIAFSNAEWVDWIVAVSEGVREKLQGENSNQAKLATIPVGLRLPSCQRRQQFAATPLRLLFVGRISKEKNLPGLLRILSSLESKSVPFTMSIVGDGPEQPSVSSSVKTSHFAKRVKLLGVRRPDEIGRLLDEHDFMLLTSHFEGTPHAVLEAMAHGLVVLASRLPGSTDRIITHAQDGFLCDRESPEDYVQILEKFAVEPGQFGRISAAAQQSVASRYDANLLAAEYEKLFKRTVTRRARSVMIPSRGSIQIPPGLLPNFPGLLMQFKHRMADLFRKGIVHQ